MFGFFEGVLGDILAPIVPQNQLFLAIQHHRHQETQDLIATNQFDIRKLGDNGCGAIHVACRYNNRFAVDLLLHRGVDLSFTDNSGNTPLHFAAKYGNIELCKFLVDQGSQPGRPNGQRQTAYDVAESHIVRQFLLPLVLASERERENMGSQMPQYGQQQPLHGMQMGTGGYQAQSSFHAPHSQPMYPPAAGQSNVNAAAPSNPNAIPGAPPMAPPSLASTSRDAHPGVGACPPSNAAATLTVPPRAAPTPGAAGVNMFRSVAPTQPSYVVEGNQWAIPAAAQGPVPAAIAPTPMPPVAVPPSQTPAPAMFQPQALPQSHPQSHPQPQSHYQPSVPALAGPFPHNAQFYNPSAPGVEAAIAAVPTHQFVPRPTNSSSTLNRLITPDGFGSSASDVRLQQKYGNANYYSDVPTSAPPPMSGGYHGQVAGIAPPMSSAPQVSAAPPSMHVGNPHPAPAVSSVPVPAPAPTAPVTKTVSALPASSMPSRLPLPLPPQMPAAAPYATAPPMSVPPRPAPAPLPQPHATIPVPIPSSSVNVFNPATDITEVISSTSKSVL